MKKLLLALAALAVSATAHAQEARRPFGLGVAIVPLEGGAPRTIEVYAPIAVAPTLRLEPSLGVLTRDAPAGETDERDVTVGLGVFYVAQVAAPVDLYFGGRLKLNFAHVERNTVDNSGTDVVLAAAAGAEHYLATHFSLGAEAQLGYRSDSDASGDADGFFTTGLAFLRFYF